MREKLDMLPEGNLKDFSRLLNDEMSGKKTSLAEQRNLTTTQGKKEKREATQEDYKDLVSYTGRKLTGPKPS